MNSDFLGLTGRVKKIAAIRELHTMIIARLFRAPRWLADRESAVAIQRKLTELGLDEELPQEVKTWRSTALGRELNLDLAHVFIGLIYEGDVPPILQWHGLIEEFEEIRIHDRLVTGADPELVLRGIVRRAYLEFYNPSGLLS